jgi:glyoxylase-like metal-dependent hydrolase (beta-lactamase superfamily II)
VTQPSFFNSAIVRVPERLILKGGSWRTVDVGVRYGIVEHPRLGPILIDTGYGPRATEGSGRSLMLQVYGAVLRPSLIAQQSPLNQLQRLGYRAEDVSLAIVTHFHPDHIAALRDFPRASFVTSGKALRAIRSMNPVARIHRGIFVELLPDDFDSRVKPIEDTTAVLLPFGLGTGLDILGDGSCLAIDLPGHAIGHFGLIWPRLDPPVLYAVDTTWLPEALDHRLPSGPARLIYEDRSAMAKSARFVHEARQAGCRVVLCHDRVTS